MLSGSKISLATFEREHAQKTLTWLNDTELCKFLGRTEPISQAEQEIWFELLKGKKSETLFFAIETTDTKEHAGNVWLHGIDTKNAKAEVRIVLDPKHSGKGLGVEALSLIKQYGFEWLNLHKLTGYVLSFNLPAQKAFEKAGYICEAVLTEERWSNGRYVDLHVFSSIRGR